MAAIASDKLEMVSRLVDLEADINAADDRGETALSLACRRGKTDLFRVLIAKGADITARTKEGQTLLMMATAVGNKEIVSRLLDLGADVNQKDRNGRTALFLIGGNEPLEIAGLLLKKGANASATDEHGTSLLMEECRRKGRIEMVRLLLERKAGPDIVSKTGVTALGVAEHPEIRKMLKDLGAKELPEDSERIRRIVWYGSINLLSYGSAQESFMRLKSPNIAHELMKDLEN